MFATMTTNENDLDRDTLITQRDEIYFKTYSHTYQIYTKNFIKINQAVSEECDHKHSDTRFLYIRLCLIITFKNLFSIYSVIVIPFYNFIFTFHLACLFIFVNMKITDESTLLYVLYMYIILVGAIMFFHFMWD